MRKAGYLFSFLFLIHTGIKGQILDDSTRQVYGPSSTGYILESDVFKNRKITYHPDTLIHRFYKTDMLSASGWMYQDLGNTGTASKSILFMPNESIFTETGFQAFSLYAPRLNEVKYFNTKSPFTNMGYVQGFKGNSQLIFTHSQNVNSRLNFALNVNRINASKQFNASTREDKLIDHWNYHVSSNYTGKKEKYTLLAVFYHLNHLQHEQGGVSNADSLMKNYRLIDSDYNLTYNERLSGVTSSERWNNLHLYQQYKLANGFQAFHVFDMERKKYFYNDNLFQQNRLSGIYTDTTSTADTLRQYMFLRSFTNKLGIKGRLKGFDYQAYVIHRLYDFYDRSSNISSKANTPDEIFLGAQAAFYLNDSSKYILAEAEIGPSAYKIDGELHYNDFIVRLRSSSYPPGLIYREFRSEAMQWDNSFSNPLYLHLAGEYLVNVGRMRLKPSFRYTNLTRYLYFDRNALPAQSLSGINFIDAGFELGYSGRVFSLSNQLFINKKLSDKDDVLRMPAITNNTNVMFKIRYAKVLDIYAGLDIYYKSAYKADAYMPLTRQFYLQDDYKIWNYAIVDPFLMFQIKRVRLAFKYSNAGHGLIRNGYFTTPYYLGMRSSFFLKVEWPLFD